jgi:hypothetical protein
MRAEDPEVAFSRNRCRNNRWDIILRTRPDRLLLRRLVQDRVDLAQRKTGDLDVVELQVIKTLIFDRKDVPVPIGKLGDPVVSNSQGLFGSSWSGSA